MLTNEQKQIALSVAESIPEFIWREGSTYESGIVEAQLFEFVEKYLTTLETQQ